MQVTCAVYNSVHACMSVSTFTTLVVSLGKMADVVVKLSSPLVSHTTIILTQNIIGAVTINEGIKCR